MKYLELLKELNQVSDMGDLWHISLYKDGSGEIFDPGSSETPLCAFSDLEDYEVMLGALIKKNPQSAREAVQAILNEGF